LNKNTFIPLKQLPFTTFSEINISSKAEFSTQILLWREQQCHQNPDLGYTDSKSANDAAAAKLETQVKFFRIGYHGENCAHVLYQSGLFP
jgi:hypothetical protein